MSTTNRTTAIAAMLLSATMLTGCATNRTPQFSYDDSVPPLPVVQAAVTNDTPRPLHVPPAWTVARGGEAAGTPAGRVENANAAARVEPRREGYYNAIQIYPWSEGALYQVYAAVGQITTIALEPGESLTGAGPIAAGDTARWIIGPPVRRGRAAPWQRQPPAGRQDRPHQPDAGRRAAHQCDRRFPVMTDNTITDTAAPMRLRAELPRVTRLSRKMLAGVGAAALLGIGGALIYALQSHDAGQGGRELYSTENRPTADGLSGMPRDYTGPVLGPAPRPPHPRLTEPGPACRAACHGNASRRS